MNIDVGDVVKFIDDDTLYKVSGIISDPSHVFCFDPVVGGEFEKSFDDVETFWRLTHKETEAL
jgi:hypothetical protein